MSMGVLLHFPQNVSHAARIHLGEHPQESFMSNTTIMLLHSLTLNLGMQQWVDLRL